MLHPCLTTTCFKYSQVFYRKKHSCIMGLPTICSQWGQVSTMKKKNRDMSSFTGTTPSHWFRYVDRHGLKLKHRKWKPSENTSILWTVTSSSQTRTLSGLPGLCNKYRRQKPQQRGIEETHTSISIFGWKSLGRSSTNTTSLHTSHPATSHQVDLIKTYVLCPLTQSVWTPQSVPYITAWPQRFSPLWW